MSSNVQIELSLAYYGVCAAIERDIDDPVEFVKKINWVEEY